MANNRTNLVTTQIKIANESLAMIFFKKDYSLGRAV